jgi:NAD(P)-dependent dehydrogenase (short-subunit alcohol dehydrogenase family)
LDKPVVVITEALTGTGRAAAAFAEKGANVVVAGQRDEAGKASADELRSLGSEAAFNRADARNEDHVRALVNEAVTRFGRLDVAVNTRTQRARPAGSRTRPRRPTPRRRTRKSSL